MSPEHTDHSLYDPIRWKAGVLVVLFTAAFLLIGVRLFQVQVVNAEDYRDAARKQYESRVILRAERGAIQDRHGSTMATTLQMTSYAVDPQVVRQPERIAKLLAQVTGDSASIYLRKIESASNRFVWLARGVNSALYPELDTFRDVGLIRVKEPKRHYTYDMTAVHVLGITDTENEGLTGLELQYNDLLKGESGFIVMQRDGRGRLRPGVNPERKAPRNGSNIHLTLDVVLQRIAEEELKNGVNMSGATGGTVIAIEPSTGDILAIASMPSFNPYRLHKASPDDLRIRAVTDIFEPGSVIKPFVAAAAIEENLLRPADTVSGEGGSITFAGRRVNDEHPLGRVPFAQALAQSSNVAMVRLAGRLPDHKFYRYLRDFGFGIPTGVDLPGEVRGVLRKPHQFEPETKAFMSFGYAMSSTALQLAMAYAAIANKGILMQPRLVKAFVDEDQSHIRETRIQKVRQVISAATADSLVDMLIGAVEVGTARQATIPGMQVAGKTGTAQQLTKGVYGRTEYTASFVGFFPARNPRAVIVVVLDRPRTSIYGGTVAAPIFRRIVEKSMTLFSLDDHSRRDLAKEKMASEVVIPDVRGLSVSSADSLFSKIGLVLDEISANGKQAVGTIIQQVPRAGNVASRGTLVRVIVDQPDTAQMEEHPNVIGLPFRKAILELHRTGYNVKIKGSGIVKQQVWDGDVCTLVGSDM